MIIITIKECGDMKKFRDIGFKLTPQRIAVLEYLEDNKEHPSAETVYTNVSKKFPTMSFATVYNTLAALRERGYLLELTIDADKRRYDPNTRPHNHLICTRCRKIIDVHREYMLQVPEHLREGYEINGNHIEFYGICPECKQQAAV
jgi:Fur family peroxide stress response transcriptional regulator